MRKYLRISDNCRIFASEKETNNKLNPKTRKGTEIMKTIEINFDGLKNLNIANIEESNTETFVIQYFFNDCPNYFTKEIEAEDLEEAIRYAKAFIWGENAKVQGKRKAGNYIDRAFIDDKVALNF